MILVRNIFQVKFGRMKEAKEVWKEMLTHFPGESRPRLLTDLTGQYYTLVLETTYKDMGEYETLSQRDLATPAMGALYQKLVAFVDSGRREMFTILE